MINKTTVDEKIKQIENLINKVLDNIERSEGGLLVYSLARYEICCFNLKNQYKITYGSNYVKIDFFGSTFTYNINEFVSYNFKLKNLIMDILENSIKVYKHVPINELLND